MKKICILLLLSFLSLLSCEEILLEDDISNKSVSLTAPFDGAGFNSTSVTFNWEPVSGATGYRLQIARPNFSDPLEIVVDVIVESNSSIQQLNVGEYAWRVKAINSSYETSYSTRSLTIFSNDDFQNNTVVLLSPSNGLITNTATQNLTWQNILGATTYQVHIKNSTGAVVLDESITSTNYSFNFLEGQYTWEVRASNGSQQTLYSGRSILIDTTPPNTPSLSVPANNSFTDENDVFFQWNRVPHSGSIEFDSIYIYKNNLLTDLKVKDMSDSPFETTLETGTYFWFVKSFDEAGNIGSQSTIFSFTVN